MEWSLFRTAIISSAVESCGRKRLRMAAGSEKTTPWWNQDVREAIPAKKRCVSDLIAKQFQTLEKLSSSELQSQYSEARKAAAQAVKTSIGRNLVFGWILTIHRQTKYFGRPFAGCVGKVYVPRPPSRIQLEYPPR